MMRLVRNIGAGALVMAFLVPLLGYGLSAYRGVTEAGTENRRLAPWPEWNGSARDYTAAIDAHLSDRFGGRMTLIRFARECGCSASGTVGGFTARSLWPGRQNRILPASPAAAAVSARKSRVRDAPRGQAGPRNDR